MQRAAEPIDGQAVRRIADAFDSHDPRRVLDVFGDRFELQDMSMPEPITDRETALPWLQGQFGALPDYRVRLERIPVSGREAAAVGVGRGTNSGPLPAPDGKAIPPTNRPVTDRFMLFVRFDGRGKIEVLRFYRDMLSFLRQLGSAP